VLYIAIRYRKSFDRLVERFCEETEEISSTSLGITAKFSKAAEHISKISEKLPEDQKEAKTALNNTRRELIEGQMKELAKGFFRLGLEGRMRTAKLVYDLAPKVDLEFVLRLAKSERPGERVAAGICLEAMLNVDDALLTNEMVSEALGKGIEDVYSRVRYRYIDAIASRDELISRFQKQLRKIAKADENDEVRGLAHSVLDEI
jgi:hypothetical protein